jgi:predicted transcriptional regulator
MPCVNPDGKPSDSGMNMLRAIQGGKQTAEDIAAATGMPMYRVRSGLREMAEAGFVVQSNDVVSLSDEGHLLL